MAAHIAPEVSFYGEFEPWYARLVGWLRGWVS